MAEKLTLTSPVSHPSTTEYFVDRLDLNWRDASIHIELHNNTGSKREFDYRGPTATNMMIVLNKANLSSNSLHKRVLTQLINDFPELTGTISGSPD